ncbi:hypothetical protein [Kitasatospora viridis]|uniref:Uncharacterized protein n=1 Tax=Kitasatospora viridis TaxID=281105 RepID=A0A561SA40_9ACTN|nr:hypothetical protein [Kitasatospora viridis]TWF71741.1 hypothetical protein FHX73_18112 [Kitasatospora viridis]
MDTDQRPLLWRTTTDDRTDYDSDLTQGRLGKLRLVTAALREQAVDVALDEYDARSGEGPIQATRVEVEIWATAHDVYTEMVDEALADLKVHEKVFELALQRYQDRVGAAERLYQQHAGEPIAARYEEMAASLEAERERAEAEQGRQAEQQLAAEDAVLGSRDWVIARPKIDISESFPADALVPTIHTAACPAVAKKSLPGVRLEDIGDLAVTGADEVYNSRHDGPRRGCPTGTKLPVKWCRRCKAAATALDCLGDHAPAWRAKAQQAIDDAEHERLHTRPKIGMDDVKALLTRMGAALYNADTLTSGFHVHPPRNAQTFRAVKAAEQVPVSYTFEGGVRAASSDLASGQLPDVANEYEWVAARIQEHGHKMIRDRHSADFFITRMTVAEAEEYKALQAQQLAKESQ